MQGDSGENYELIEGVYHYKDSTGKQYKFDVHSQEWVQKDTQEKIVDSFQKSGEYKDEEGRKYYYNSAGEYACDDAQGNTFYYKDESWVTVDKEKETVKVETQENNIKEKNADPNPGGSRWYFYKDQDAFYRDAKNDKVYRWNESTHAWEEEKKELKSFKRKKRTEEEEFDTDDEGEEDDPSLLKVEEHGHKDGNLVPPGYGLDPCVTFEDGVYMKRDPHDGDGTPYEWDSQKKAWFPKVDETFLASYQLKYGFRPDGSLDPNPVKYDDNVNEEDEIVEQPEPKGKGKKGEKSEKGEKKKPGWFEVSEEDTLSVYVSGLPVQSFTEEDFVTFMTRCGLIARDDASKNLKVKLYRDKEGKLKGDALCTYLKVESVGLALQILDGACIGAHTVKVERAKFNLKGEYNPSLKPVKKKRRKDKEKEKKQKERLLDWRPDPLRGERKKNESVVIVKNVFEVNDKTTKEDVKKHEEAIQAHAQAFGEVVKVEAFEHHPEGVVKVRFKDATAADLCRITFEGRLYAGRRLKADTWDGKEKFIIEETEEQRKERLLKWEKYLEEN